VTVILHTEIIKDIYKVIEHLAKIERDLTACPFYYYYHFCIHE